MQVELVSDCARAVFEPHCGLVPAFETFRSGRRISMLHQAPWRRDDIAMPDGSPPHQRVLAGDFFCAPFGNAAADGAPLHGWPANADWTVTGIRKQGGLSLLTAALQRPVMGAALIKELALHDGQPFLYQRHVFTGGAGRFAAANHAMLSLPDSARLAFSPKRFFETPADPLESDPERGRSLLSYPARSANAHFFPLFGGGTVDLTSYPLGSSHEDFVIGVEAPGSALGWTLVQRPVQNDLFISLRNATRLPLTMMWHSNGGRNYAPWNGRHRGVLGIEEGVGFGLLGVSSNEGGAPFGGDGTPSALELTPGGTIETRHVIGCIAWPGDSPVSHVALAENGSGNGLEIVGADGRREIIALDTAFLELA